MDAYEAAWTTVVKCRESGEGDSGVVEVKGSGLAQKVLNHMNSAADVCEFFGREVVVGEVSPSSIEFRNVGEDKSQEEFGYDPFWDDDEDEWSPSSLAGFDVEDTEEEEAEFFHDLASSVPDDDEVVLEQSKTWVAALMSDMGICPFTQGHLTAGLPSGRVRYIVSRSKTVEEVYEDYWREVNLLRNTEEKEVSTTLLICPEMWMKGNGSGEVSGCEYKASTADSLVASPLTHPHTTHTTHTAGLRGVLEHAQRLPHGRGGRSLAARLLPPPLRLPGWRGARRRPGQLCQKEPLPND